MEKKQYRFGFIGMGNMGFAMLKGLLTKYEADQLTFFRRNREKAEDISACTGVTRSESNAACAVCCDCLILAVKPQQLDGVIEEIRDAVTKDQIVISIAPGYSIAALQEKLGGHVRVVRAMPNMPALVGEGMTGVCSQSTFQEEELLLLQRFFESFGKMKWVEERLMDAVVCVSGSSPAFVYLFVEALADGAVKYGLPRDAAYEMAAQTLLGSARMVLETGEHPGRLKDQVCSPGGTTIAGVSALEEWGFRNAVIKATDACYEKCKKIGTIQER